MTCTGMVQMTALTAHISNTSIAALLSYLTVKSLSIQPRSGINQVRLQLPSAAYVRAHHWQLSCTANDKDFPIQMTPFIPLELPGHHSNRKAAEMGVQAVL